MSDFGERPGSVGLDVPGGDAFKTPTGSGKGLPPRDVGKGSRRDVEPAVGYVKPDGSDGDNTGVREERPTGEPQFDAGQDGGQDSKDKDGRPVIPQDPTTGATMLPKDADNNPILPQTQNPDGGQTLPINQSGETVVPKDKDGNIVAPKDAQGNPLLNILGGKIVLDLDKAGKPIIPVDSDGNPVIKTDKDGKIVPPVDENGNFIPVIGTDYKPIVDVDESDPTKV